MNIGFLCNELSGIGGVEIISAEKLAMFKELGHNSYCLTFKDDWAGDLFRNRNLPIHVAEGGRTLEVLAKELGLHVIHGHSAGGGSAALETAKKLREEGHPIIGGEMVHSMGGGYTEGDFEVVHTQACHNIRPRSTFISWGFDINRLMPTESREETRDRLRIPRDAYVIGRNGRLDGSKDPVGFLHTLAYYPNAHGLLCGWGPMRSDLGIMATQLGIMNRLTFTGAIYDVANMFNAMDTIVYPTTDESFCAGVVEAMYLKKPVICYVRGGMGQHCIHEETCLVGNSPQELAGHINRLKQYPETAKKLGEAAHEKCKALGYWDLKRDAEEHLKLYEKVYKEIVGEEISKET